MESSEYEILPKEMLLQETPIQKLRRLMYEVKELGQETEMNEKVLASKRPRTRNDKAWENTAMFSDYDKPLTSHFYVDDWIAIIARSRTCRRRDLTQGFAVACQVVGARPDRNRSDAG